MFCPATGSWIVETPSKLAGTFVTNTQLTGGLRLVVEKSVNGDAHPGQLSESKEPDWLRLRLG